MFMPVFHSFLIKSVMNTRTKILTESRVYSPLSVIFYVYLGVSPPLLEKSYSTDHINKCGLKITLSLFTAAQNLKSQTSNRHRFSCGGVVSALRLPFSLEALFLSGDFRILLFNHLGKLFFAFYSCVGVDIKLFAFAVWQFRRIAAFLFLRTDLKQTPRSGAAYFRLLRFKFCSYGRFRRLVGCFPVLAQSALISAEPPFDFAAGVVAVGYGFIKVGVVFTNQLINFIVLIGALAVAVANRRNIALRRVAVHKAAV